MKKILKFTMTLLLLIPKFTVVLLWRVITKKKNWLELKIALARLGMKHFESEDYGYFGKCEGLVKGYKVTFGHDDRKGTGVYINVGFNCDMYRLNLYHLKPHWRPHEGESDIPVLNKAFGKVFGRRRAEHKTASAIGQSQEWQDHFGRFYNKWYFKIPPQYGLVADSHGFQLTGIGFPYIIFHYDPVLVEKIIFDMVDLVEHLDSVVEANK